MKVAITRGVNDLNLSQKLLVNMIRAALRRWIESNGGEYMTVFRPVGIDIEVSDGNDNVFERWINDLHLKDKVWVMISDHEEGAYCTILLPEEY